MDPVAGRKSCGADIIRFRKEKAMEIPYHGERDIDFDVMRVYPKEIINFTLTKDGRLIDHKPSDL